MRPGYARPPAGDDSSSNFVAFDAVRGVPLWHERLHTSITNGPITYRLDDAQYVVVGAGDRLYAFTLRQSYCRVRLQPDSDVEAHRAKAAAGPGMPSTRAPEHPRIYFPTMWPAAFSLSLQW